MIRCATALAVLVLLSAPTHAAVMPSPIPLEYPPAPRSAVIDDYFGTRVPDTYRSLEELDAPSTVAWVSAQAQLTDRYLAALPARAALRARLAKLYDYERLGIPMRKGERYFFTRNTGQQDQSVLYMARSLGEPGAVVLDPNTLSSDGHLAVVGYEASRDGALMAYGVSVSGSDWTDWHIRDVTTGRDLPDVLRFTKYYAPAFTHDGKGLYYSAFPAPAKGAELTAQDLGNALYLHALGTPSSADRRILVNPAHADWQYEPQVSSDGRWLIVRVGEGQVGDKARENVYLLDLHAPASAPVPLAEGFDAAYAYVGADAGRLYFLTTLDAPRGRVIGVDPTKPARKNWRTVVGEGEDAIDLTRPSVSLVNHQLIVQTLHDATSRVALYDLEGRPVREVSLPRAGTARGFGGEPEEAESFYSFTDLITPAAIYRYDLRSGASTLVAQPKVAFDAERFTERQVFYRGKDGTRIPMLLAYRKGLELNGHNPVLLYGYGGFGIPMLPSFNPARIAWLEMGGVFAIANIRGGGEYGEAWHRQGIREHKQTVFDDFIAAAEWLIAEHYTAPDRLAIEGGSNGGLLIGACLTQRPELFGTAIVEVGVLDMLRFDRFGQGAGWVGDYGSPQNPQDFKALYAYSPVHRVRSGVHYPPTLIVTGDHDTRVMPMHSFKFAAALQAAQAGAAPVLLRVQYSSGHGGGPTISQAIEQNADVLAFIAHNFALSPP